MTSKPASNRSSITLANIESPSLVEDEENAEDLKGGSEHSDERTSLMGQSRPSSSKFEAQLIYTQHDVKFIAMARLGDVASMRQSVEKGANPECFDPTYGMNALHFAAANCRAEVVQVLIEEYDVNIHVKSEKQSKTAAEYLDDFVTVNEPLSPVEEQDVIKAKALLNPIVPMGKRCKSILSKCAYIFGALLLFFVAYLVVYLLGWMATGTPATAPSMAPTSPVTITKTFYPTA